MHDTNFVNSFFSSSRYSAKRMTKPVHFVCQAPQAAQVHLAGDFNSWHPTKHPMQRQADGAWILEVALHHGHHQYRFLVDGQPTLDPNAHGIARDSKGEKASLIAVS